MQEVNVEEPATADLRRMSGNSGRRTHILYIIDTLYNPAGGENALQKIVRGLPRDRYRCSIVTFLTGPFKEWLEAFECPIHLLRFRKSYGWSGMKAAVELSKLIRAEKVDIVHTFFPTADLWGGVIAKLNGCPILVSSRRDMGFQMSRFHLGAYRVARFYVDQVQAVSDAVRLAAIEREHINPAKIITVPNGIEVDRLQPGRTRSTWRAELGVDDSTRVIACVGNIRHVKGIDILVRAAAIVHRQIPNAIFAIAGSPWEDYWPSIQKLTNDLGLNQVIRYLGCIGDVAGLLNASDLFCLPSRSEGMSNALLEAMAFGLPCVATRVGGNAEVMGSAENGVIVPPENVEALGEAILHLLRNPDEAKRTGTVARRRIEQHFTTDAMIGRMVNAYDQLLYEKRPAGH